MFILWIAGMLIIHLLMLIAIRRLMTSEMVSSALRDDPRDNKWVIPAKLATAEITRVR
jgi:beta-lactamase regulating signal transducer with metallopeptidase domain